MGVRLGDPHPHEFHPRDIIVAGVSAALGGLLVLTIREPDTETKTREVVVQPPAIEDGSAVIVAKDTPLVIDGQRYLCDWGEGQELDRPGREIKCSETGEG